MNNLHFMHRKFSGQCWAIADLLENEAFRKALVFEDSWYFLRYRFFGRDCICSETADTVQTHLYNLASVLYRDFESLTGADQEQTDRFLLIIDELMTIAEYSASFAVCVWAFGDETTAELLSEWLSKLPTPEQMAQLLKLPHMTRHELERKPYRHNEPNLALKRCRKEQADFNRRRKQPSTL